MSDIASASNIGKSLIYHYFESKIHLWNAVKQDILHNYIEPKELEEMQHLDFTSFIKKLITLRFDLYIKNPDIVKMITLQRIEESSDTVSMRHGLWYTNIKKTLSEFQKQGHIYKNIDPDFATYFILSNSTSLFFDFNNKTIKQKREEYLEQITNLILNALSPSHKS